MKIQDKETSLVDTNSKALKVFQSRVHDAGLVMKYLAGLYPNPIQTLTQEYLSNGRDATREAKSNKPLLITLPTEKIPTLKIRDYGVGLSEQRVEDVFVSFGNSTKRDTNNQIGGFGVGGKSAWSYTDNFTIVSYVDGVAHHYIALADGGKGISELQLQAKNPTSEPNGVEIQIAVKKDDVEKFVAAVERATMFWETLPTFTGEMIPYEKPAFQAGMVEFYAKNKVLEVGKIYLAVDGIPYEVSHMKYSELPEYRRFKDRLGKIDTGYYSSEKNLFDHVIIHCQTGDVEIALNRESLQDSEFTQKGLKKIFSDAMLALDKKASDKLREKTSLVEFLETHKNLRKFFGITKHEKFIDVSGDEYVVDTRGYIVSGLPSNLKVTYLRKRPRKKIEIFEKNPSEVSLLNAFFINKKTSHNSLTIRLRDNMPPTEDSNTWNKENGAVVVHCENFSDPQFLELVNRLNLKNVYDFQVKDAPISDRATDENEVLVNYYTSDSSWRSLKTLSDKVNMETVEKTHIYAFKEGENANDVLCKYWQLNKILEKLDMKLCFIPSSREKKIIGKEKFVSVENFFKNLKKYVSQENFELMRQGAARSATDSMRSKLRHLINSPNFMKQLPNVKDRETVNMISKLSQIDQSTSSDAFIDSSSGLLNAIAALCPDVNELKLETEKIFSRFNSQYFMLCAYHGDDEQAVKELVWYLNTKYENLLKS